MSTITRTEELSKINQKIVHNGETLPQVRLKNAERKFVGEKAKLFLTGQS